MSNHTTVAGAVALVTGANRGIGAAFVQGLLDAGARRVYAAARNPQTLATLAQRDTGSSRSRSTSPTTALSRKPQRSSSISLCW
jgi:NAD(P)-dependent dehydrogenase (short-subunit alcohol dehydrogenase family)